MSSLLALGGSFLASTFNTLSSTTDDDDATKLKKLEFNKENRDNIIRWTISIVLPLGGALYKIIFKRRLDSPSAGQVNTGVMRLLSLMLGFVMELVSVGYWLVWVPTRWDIGLCLKMLVSFWGNVKIIILRWRCS